jgi:uncharacterized protein YnzC (UPF0291/DUF896 family)
LVFFFPVRTTIRLYPKGKVPNKTNAYHKIIYIMHAEVDLALKFLIFFFHVFRFGCTFSRISYMGLAKAGFKNKMQCQSRMNQWKNKTKQKSIKETEKKKMKKWRNEWMKSPRNNRWLDRASLGLNWSHRITAEQKIRFLKISHKFKKNFDVKNCDKSWTF